MSKELAFDKKNEQDYDKNTQLITEALAKISANPKLKTTKQEIVNLTGLSRNTVSNRASQEHPKIINSTLKDIKDRRDKSKQKSKEEKANQALKLNEKSKLIEGELVYWFTETQKLKKALNQLIHTSDIMTESRDFYANELKKERQKVQDLQNQNALLSQLIDTKED
jgi:hypothetical protein